MSTSAAKAQANRANAKLSTGPRTEAGKAATSQNALKFGLFSTTNCVQPHEQDEYNQVCAQLWDSLNPVGLVEELHATEVVRCAWRLRRCAHAEGSLLALVHHEFVKGLYPTAPPDVFLDPMLYPSALAVQSSVDRARGQAQSAMRRALADLRNLQTERHLRSEVLNPGHDPSHFGLASLRDVIAGINDHARTKLQTAKVNTLEATNRIIARESQGIPDVSRADEFPPKAARAESARAEKAKSEAARAEPATAGQPGGAPETKDPKTQNEATPNAPERFASPPITPRPSAVSRPTPRNANCPCGSGRKHKRCCGQNAPPLRTMAA